MSMMLRQFVERQRAAVYASFAGASAQARIPLRQRVLDDLTDAFLEQCPPAIQHLQVTLLEHNRLEVLVIVHKWHLTRRFVIELEIEPVIDVARAPVVRMWLSRRQRLLGTLAQLFTRLGGHLPPGLYLSPDLVEIDFGLLLYQHDLLELLRWLQTIELHGQPGLLMVTARLVIPPPAAIQARRE